MVIDTYTHMNRTFDENVDFFNHGYSPPYPQYNSFLMKNRMSLYHYLIKDIDADNKKILDVGCGRGGFSRVYNNFNFSEIHGCDVSVANINFAEEMYECATFKLCDAHNLTDFYEEGYFDVITNLESAHHYNDRNLFFRQAKKILKKEGVFIYSDVDAYIDDYFDVIIKDDITENVKRSTSEILEECNLINDPDIKSFVVPLAEHAYNLYHKDGKKYIKYTCYDKERK